MKQNGFIATSLIYSFFLVFIAILAALLNDFIANKMILERYNDEAEQSLNTHLYDVAFITSGANTSTDSHRGQTLTNLIQNGDFKDSSWWDKEGTLNFGVTNFSKTTAKLSNVLPNSYIYQNVQILNEKQYYMSLEYAQNFSAPVQAFINPNYSLLTQDSSLVWKRASLIFTSDVSGSQTPFKMGLNNIRYNELYLTNVLLINLTDHFGEGNEPTAKWMENNIDYFNGTINFLKEEDVSGDQSLSLKMIPIQPNFNKAEVSCVGDNGIWISTSSNTKVEYSKEDEQNIGTLTLSDITDDITCTVRWSL